MTVPQINIPLKPACVDLHIHSTASDGSLSPPEIIKAAERAGLRAIAITDHDTLEGCVDALAHQHASDVEILSGIELSVISGSRVIHILGYLIHTDDPFLRQTLGIIQRSRADRNLKILHKLRALGFDVEYDEVLEVGGEGQMGRPHIAQVLVNKRIVHNIDEAFAKYLKKGRPAYADRYRLRPDEAIQMILRAGGVPVLAHPSSIHTESEADLERIIAELKQAGLRGIEAYYPGHGPARTAQYRGLAHRYGLLVTGGTDFHGAIKPGIHIGVGNGDLRVPYSVVEDLKRSAASKSEPRS